MDIAYISSQAVKIKGKVASFIVGKPETKAKLAADAVIAFDASPVDTSTIEGARVTIGGPGDYEVSGVKFGGLKGSESALYYISLDNMIVLVAKASALKSKEILRDADIALLEADSLVDTSLLATLNPKVCVFYGSEAQANIASLGKETTAVSKYTTTRDKLPAEMEAVLLS